MTNIRYVATLHVAACMQLSMWPQAEAHEGAETQRGWVWSWAPVRSHPAGWQVLPPHSHRCLISFPSSEYFSTNRQRQPVQCVVGRHGGRWWSLASSTCRQTGAVPCFHQPTTHQNWSLATTQVFVAWDKRSDPGLVTKQWADNGLWGRVQMRMRNWGEGWLVEAAVNQFASGCSATPLLLHQPPAGRGDLRATSVTSAHDYKIYKAVKTVASQWDWERYVNNQVSDCCGEVGLWIIEVAHLPSESLWSRTCLCIMHSGAVMWEQGRPWWTT